MKPSPLRLFNSTSSASRLAKLFRFRTSSQPGLATNPPHSPLPSPLPITRRLSTATMSDDLDHLQDQVNRHSLSDPEGFWRHQAEQLTWHKFPTKMLTVGERHLPNLKVTHPTWEWFKGGEISTCYNMIDRHVLAGNGNRPAFFYDSPVTRTKATITYSDLLEEVETLAGVLREQGVKKGDVVLLYMPQIPAAPIGILASNRLGAIHCVVFGGFSGAALAQRIDAVRPAAILTASCGIDGVKPPIPYQPFMEEALSLATHKPKSVLVWNRPQLGWPVDSSKGELDWQGLVASARKRGVKAECVPVPASDPVYISHTSGTTGAPKGVIRESGGHAVGLHLSISMVFNIHGPGSVIFSGSDIGWVLGHAFIMSAPLLTGAASVLYEGKPIGTPNAGAFWRIIDEYRVNTLYCAPTSLRAIKTQDPESKFLKAVGERGGLRSLGAIFLAGERSEPTIITQYQDFLDKYGAPNAHVIDNWWSTESGSPITSRALVPHAGADRQTSIRNHAPPQLRPGSAGKAMPGFDIHIVDDEGKECPRGTMGNIVLGLPLPPTSFRTLWEDDERFYRGYLARFSGKWLDTGDSGYMDEQGYVNVMSRNDDVLNVSAHRLSSAAIEQAIVSHPDVGEACIVGIPDALKGTLPFAFVTLTTSPHPTSAVPTDKLFKEINDRVRASVGTIASLGGMVQGAGMIPKTRSGKTLRRVLRSLVENAVHDDFDAAVDVPSTVEDYGAVDVARQKVREYFSVKGAQHKSIETRSKL